jgi:hypothetical protein
VDGIRADVDGIIDGMLTELPEIDRRRASKPENRAMMRESWVESVRQGSRGWADDDLAFAKPWGFELEDVTVETRVWQGELDVLTPRPHGEYVASRLPNARFELLEGGGHFIDEEWAVVLEWLTARRGRPERVSDPAAVLADHVRRFNEAVRSGDYAAMVAGFAPDAEMSLEGVPIGPFAGREAIREAYAEQPPDDEIRLLGDPRVDGDTVETGYAWAREGGRAGRMILTARGGEIARLVVTFE